MAKIKIDLGNLEATYKKIQSEKEAIIWQLYELNNVAMDVNAYWVGEDAEKFKKILVEECYKQGLELVKDLAVYESKIQKYHNLYTTAQENAKSKASSVG